MGTGLKNHSPFITSWKSAFPNDVLPRGESIEALGNLKRLPVDEAVDADDLLV